VRANDIFEENPICDVLGKRLSMDPHVPNVVLTWFHYLGPPHKARSAERAAAQVRLVPIRTMAEREREAWRAIATIFSAAIQLAPRLRALVSPLDAHGIENENVAPGPSFSFARKLP
jgi:hypothetical protein